MFPVFHVKLFDWYAMVLYLTVNSFWVDLNILFMIGTQGEVCRQLKIFLNPAVVFAADLSRALIPVVFLFFVASGFYTTGASWFKSSRAICPSVSSFF